MLRFDPDKVTPEALVRAVRWIIRGQPWTDKSIAIVAHTGRERSEP